MTLKTESQTIKIASLPPKKYTTSILAEQKSNLKSTPQSQLPLNLSKTKIPSSQSSLPLSSCTTQKKAFPIYPKSNDEKPLTYRQKCELEILKVSNSLSLTTIKPSLDSIVKTVEQSRLKFFKFSQRRTARILGLPIRKYRYHLGYTSKERNRGRPRKYMKELPAIILKYSVPRKDKSRIVARGPRKGEQRRELGKI